MTQEATAEMFHGTFRTGSSCLSCFRKARVSGLPGTVAAVLLLTLGACSGSDFKKLGSDFGEHVAKEVFGVGGDLERRDIGGEPLFWALIV